MIPLLALRLHYRTKRPITLPAFPGSTWRSALGYRLRTASCVTGAKRCDGCMAAPHCAYGQLFETPTTAALSAAASQAACETNPGTREGLLQAYPKAPHPFVLSALSGGGTYRAGDSLVVELILLAPALRWLPTLLPVLRTLQIHRSDLQLEAITQIDLHAPKAPGEPLAPQYLLAMQELECPEPPPAPSGQLGIELLHPLRLRRNNHYVGAEQFDFGAFIATLLRRASMLSTLTSQDPVADFPALTKLGQSVSLANAELRWFDWHRHSARQRQKIPMGGLLGHFQLTALPEPIWPWVWLGQWLHVGKGAVMGMGRYQLKQDLTDLQRYTP
ncbi:CRISPR system precrRNA processing endoribonuclease RAMP protein Cas6 [Halorhodospira halochloris]|uniref:CRISPR system precrRNA processing endoribonuclease RAMP protein Cas6 n=1 Tax=Halorhodospira halochloris TaxID=1052 RepID=UPI001EE787D6|nr:CRISPR system precrRNA processing endoribonuclease RAMP protein Cas6 [Halorhodospira halochloris]MCG5531154.1 CRISPR system precrRNA processing endoribonuclease RAMP protein Cas6 [Halorhodospira halochloris]